MKVEVSLTSTACWCGLPHAIPTDLYDQARCEGASVYCPLGHSWSFTDSTAKKLQRDLAQVTDARDRALRQRDEATAELARVKKRAAKGVCPCCNRSFVNVTRHMTVQHPGYVRTN
jgi:hypothetical protein